MSADVVHEEMEHFVRGHEIRLDLLESMEPNIRPIEWGRELPRKTGDMNPYIRLFERQVSHYLDAYEDALTKARERLEALDTTFRAALKERVWELIERPGRRYPAALEFLKALREPVESIEKHCLEQIERLAKAARSAGEEFRSETLENAVISGQLASFAERLQTSQRLEKQLHFYRSLRKFAFEAMEFVKTLMTNLDTLQREIARLSEAQGLPRDGRYRVNARFPVCPLRRSAEPDPAESGGSRHAVPTRDQTHPSRSVRRGGVSRPAGIGRARAAAGDGRLPADGPYARL